MAALVGSLTVVPGTIESLWIPVLGMVDSCWMTDPDTIACFQMVVLVMAVCFWMKGGDTLPCSPVLQKVTEAHPTTKCNWIPEAGGPTEKWGFLFFFPWSTIGTNVRKGWSHGKNQCCC